MLCKLRKFWISIGSEIKFRTYLGKLHQGANVDKSDKASKLLTISALQFLHIKSYVFLVAFSWRGVQFVGNFIN